MMIVTGLFFNKKGNQSFYNSIKGYLREYNIIILTAATLDSDVYLELETVKKQFPNIKIVSVFPYRIMSTLTNIVSAFLSIIPPKKSNGVSIDNSNDLDGMLVNMLPTIKSKISFYLRSLLLSCSSFVFYIFNRVDVVCCYEINGCLASSLLKRIFSVPVFIKLQGTALGGQLNLLGTKEFNNVFAIDIKEIKRAKIFDLAIMTNDGTRGDKVLNYYGFPLNNILFINNGIDDRFDRSRRESSPIFDRDKLKSIKLCSVSRLTSWKRVGLILKIIKELKEKIHIEYDLIGIGDQGERNSINELIETYDLKNNVKFYNGASTEEVIGVMNSSDLLISINKFTNVSNPVFEGLYTGLPIITIAQVELVEVLGSGTKSCILVDDSDNDEELVEEIVTTLINLNPEYYNNLSNNTAEFRKEFLTWEERSSKELINIKRVLQ